MIDFVRFTDPAPSRAVSITMKDGAVWSTDASFPPDTEIRVALADWLASGGVIQPYTEPPSPPREIHAAWFKAALAHAGKAATVDAAVAASGPVKAALWANVTTVREDHPDIIAIAAALNIDLKAMFDLAAQIRDASP